MIADHLADLALDLEPEPEAQFPDKGIYTVDRSENKWQLFFDGAANKRGFGVGILLIDPSDVHMPIVIRLDFNCSNNTAEYEACIAGLEEALNRGG